MVLTCFTSDFELPCGENNLTEVHINSAQECGVSVVMDTMEKGAASPKNTEGREEKELSPSGCSTTAGLTLTFCFSLYSRALQKWHLPEGFVPSVHTCTAGFPPVLLSGEEQTGSHLLHSRALEECMCKSGR